MSKLRPDPAITLKDSPRDRHTPGEVPVTVPQDLAREAIEACRMMEEALRHVQVSPSLEAVYWAVRDVVLKANK